ncbi:O-acetylhomoserine aminocarboxypropyltransferase/cysteine synthase family protein [Nocardioides sp. cx-173]|uniref:O-acetylhomoserine aminocarboxypropyltransferase/cysteine synthase family protein n=1 Tax=Nocardioides sp. cx-173 TaxID=2898796 RepID=UPI001E585D85|nr:O-acetylhomoserine aminocarboxypropyltransferase/cysteine synthase family protein [Nocardioides sp. cx-173]MCD4523703.1 O-acetylhomoserine aminocarboxypropyltransferase/cysteine synthase [Nocardioides sp. cx-173]UGB41967.1 O-acetylhomoserine aminocarboxypropyltransferase/cysteine synthase [Nocardioides sp. cx-173]
MTYRPETLAVHAGQEHDPATNARAVPIYQTTSYVFNDTEHAANLFSLAEPGNIYTRIMNPTQDVFEQRMTQLEGGVGALAVASGSTATTYAVLNLTYAGDNIVALSTLYGGTYALFAHTLPQFGIEVRFVDPEKPEDLANAVDDKTRLVFGETVGNPKINVIDIPAWSEAAHALGLPLIIDNTAPTPYLVRALEQGADVVVHAATKFIGGHGTSIGGVIVDSGRFDWAAHADRFPGLTKPDPAYHGVVWTDAVGPAAYIIRARTVLLRNTGGAITPMNSWLFLQGLETLHLRMERHSANALQVAQYLAAHDSVSWVSYPGLADSPYKEVHDRIGTGKGYGGILSFGVKSGRDGGKRFIESLGLFSHLANIGDAKSLAIHNATTTHSQLTPEELVAAGVPEDMVRLSIGIENVEDLIADLDQALAASK